MTEVSQSEFDNMTPEQQEAYNIATYKARTDNNVALGQLRAHMEEARERRGEAWTTGFQFLDQRLDGGFMGGQLIFLGAISSLGKTSFALQLATQMIEQGLGLGVEKDVLIFSLEMSADELNAKIISRYTHIIAEERSDPKWKQYRMSTRDILTGRVGRVNGNEAGDEKGELFLAAYERAKRIADHLKIWVGQNDVDVEKIDEAVRTHIKATGRRPFVIVDYLQILRESDNARTTEKRLLTDYDVTRLKVISRECNVPILAISAFNRNSYLDPVNMGSFRESSGIEYSADILLGMQYHGMEYEKVWFTDIAGNKRQGYESKIEHDTRIRQLVEDNERAGREGRALKIEIKVLKNRIGSRQTLRFEFLPAYNYYCETAGGKKIEIASTDWKNCGDGDEDFSSVASCTGGGDYECLGSL